jgi:hypothetical protein
VTGGGETAGAITAALPEVRGPSAQIGLISTGGVLSASGESLTQSHLYTDAAA